MGSVYRINYPIKASGRFGIQKGPLSKVERGRQQASQSSPTPGDCRCCPAEECLFRLLLHAGESGPGVAAAATRTAASAGRNGRVRRHQHGPALTGMWMQWYVQRGKVTRSAAPPTKLQNLNPTPGKRDGAKIDP